MRRVLLAVAVLGLSVASADAGWLGGGGRKLPKPIDSPIVRPKVSYRHKVAPHVRGERAKYNQPTWGGSWDRLFKVQTRPVKSRLLR
jgi:hypothetical protein